MKKAFKIGLAFFAAIIIVRVVFGGAAHQATKSTEKPQASYTKDVTPDTKAQFLAKQQAILDDLIQRTGMKPAAFPAIQIFGGTDQGPSSATLRCRDPRKPLGTEFVLQGPGTVWYSFGVGGEPYRWIGMSPQAGGKGPSMLEQVIRNVAQSNDQSQVVAFTVSDRRPSPNVDAIQLSYFEVKHLNLQLRASSCSGWYAPTWVEHTAREVHKLDYSK